MSRTRAAFAAIAIALVVSGCALGPDTPPDVKPAPAKFAEAPAALTPTAEPSPDFAFWRELRDPLLTRLVERALAQSPDIGQATARIREARALAGVARSALFPEVDGKAGYTRQRQSFESPLLGKLPDSFKEGLDPENDDFLAALTMAYEVDIWGKNRRAREAALDELGGAIERRRAVGLALAGDVAAGYIEFRTLERRRDLAARTLAARDASLEIIRERERAGLATDLDLARAETAREAAGALVPELDRLIALAEHRLSILTGAPPGSLKAELASGAGKPLAPFAVPVGVPARLLARRPDVRADAARLAAATARIGVAKADLFPQLVIVGEIGLDAIDAGQLVSKAGAYWAVGPQLRVPLFDMGRRLNTLDASEERATEALFALERSILAALGETEAALANAREEARRREVLARAAAASERAAGLARQSFDGGLVSYLEVTEAESAQFASEDALAESEGRLALRSVQLAKAVAGGVGAVERLMPPIETERRDVN